MIVWVFDYFSLIIFPVLSEISKTCGNEVIDKTRNYVALETKSDMGSLKSLAQVKKVTGKRQKQ